MATYPTKTPPQPLPYSERAENYAKMQIGLLLPLSDEYEPYMEYEPNSFLTVIIGLLRCLVEEPSIDQTIRIKAALWQYHFYDNAEQYEYSDKEIISVNEIKNLLKIALVQHDKTWKHPMPPLWWSELPYVRELLMR